jgi:hypothetical protein
MTYTAVFQNAKGEYTFATLVQTHDRNEAWKKIHEQRSDPDMCLVLLLDGDVAIRTYEDVVDTRD